MHPEAPKKYSIDTFTKYFEHVIQGYCLNLAFVFKKRDSDYVKRNSNFKSSWS